MSHARMQTCASPHWKQLGGDEERFPPVDSRLREQAIKSLQVGQLREMIEAT